MDKITKSDITYNLQWYKVKCTDSGINKFLEDIRNNDEEKYLVVRHHYSKGRFYGVASKIQMEKMISKNVYLYEILSPLMKKKVYFDIDSKTDTLEECIKIIKQTFPNPNIQISGVKNPIEKFSYHIVLSNYYVYDTTILKEFVKKYTDLGFDPCVYNKYNLFKCINQSKAKKDAPIQEYISGDKKYTKHLVLMDFDNDAQIITELKEIKQTLEEIRKPENRNKLNKTKIELLEINECDIKHELPETFDYINARALEKLNAIPLQPRESNNTLNHITIWKIMVWSKNENIEFEDFWNWCKQKDSSEKRKLRYINYYVAASNYTIQEKFIDTILLKFYPYLKENTTEKQYRKLNEIIPTKCIESDYLQGNHICNTTPVSYLSIKMGGNKTGSVIDFIKDNYKDKSKRVLYIVPRIALANDIQERFKVKDLEFVLYNQIDDKQLRGNENNLIICINSLECLADFKYDLIIIDEIETTWELFYKNKKDLSSLWCELCRLIKDSEKTIVMDALMSMKSINTIQSMYKTPPRYEILTLSSKQEERKYIKYKSKDLTGWFESIIESILNGEKVFIFMPYKTTYDYSKRDLRCGVQSLVNYLCEKCKLIENQDIIGYYSEQKEQKANLNKINEIWGKAKCIVANTCISVGNNYSGNDFTKIFVYYSNWVVSRELIQIMYRIRNPIENIMHIYFEKKIPLIDTYKNYKLGLENDAFKELKKGLLIEDKTDPLLRMKILSKRCNIIESGVHIVSDVKQELDLSSFVISYDKVPDLSDDEYLHIKNNIQQGFVSLLERLKYEKYKLKKEFKYDTPEHVIKSFWETPLLINQLKKLDTEYNIINEILTGLGHPKFTDFVVKHSMTDLSILEIPKHITNDMIKESFDLKNEINYRNVNLVARLINAYFNKRVMYLCVDKNKKYKKMYVKKIDRYVYEYELDILFCANVEYYKEYLNI